MMARLMADQKGFASVGVLSGFVSRLWGVAVHKQQTMETQSRSQTADFRSLKTDVAQHCRLKAACVVKAFVSGKVGGKARRQLTHCIGATFAFVLLGVA